MEGEPLRERFATRAAAWDHAEQQLGIKRMECWSTEEEVLNTLMEQYLGCNWGLVTGHASGVFVLDVDGEGAAAICELERYCVEFRPALRPISVQFQRAVNELAG